MIFLSQKYFENVPNLRSLSLFLGRNLLGLVVSSTILKVVVVAVVVVVVVVVVAGVVVVVAAVLPATMLLSKGQQMLGILFVNPQENLEKNFTFSFVI